MTASTTSRARRRPRSTCGSNGVDHAQRVAQLRLRLTPTPAGGRTRQARSAYHAFLYDLDGNQAGWNATNSGQNRLMVWDEDNRLQSVTDNRGSPPPSNTTTAPTAWSRRARAARRSTSTRGTWPRSGGTRSRSSPAPPASPPSSSSSPRGEGYGTGAKNLTSFSQYFYHPDHLGSDGLRHRRHGRGVSAPGVLPVRRDLGRRGLRRYPRAVQVHRPGVRCGDQAVLLRGEVLRSEDAALGRTPIQPWDNI